MNSGTDLDFSVFLASLNAQLGKTSLAA